METSDDRREHRRHLNEQLAEHRSCPIVVDPGIAVFGEHGGTGPQVIVRVPPDRRLTILGIAETSQVAEARELLQNSPESPFRSRSSARP